MGWRDFQLSTHIDNIDKIDKSSPVPEKEPSFVDKVDFVDRGENTKQEVEASNRDVGNPLLTDTDDPEGSRAILFNVPSIGDFWCVANEATREQLTSDGLPCLLPDDLVFIKAGTTKEDRFNRLRQVVARRHPLTQAVLDIFPGSRISSIQERNLT